MTANPRDELVEKAIADVLGDDGLMLTRMVLVAEVLKADGERSVMVQASGELRTWDIAGLLAAGTARVNVLMQDEWAEPDDEEDD